MDEDPIIKEQLYRLDENWVELVTSIEKRLAMKHMEGIIIPHIHKHITNSYFGALALWVRLGGYRRQKTPYEESCAGYLA